jgi:hypothetical protein
MENELLNDFRRSLVLLAAVACCGGALADTDEDDYLPKQWQELEVVLPAAPEEGRLQPFYVSAVAESRFSIDPATLTVGDDGVVRYVLVVLTPGGARNVTFEGMRCATRERRIYASGRPDGSWSKARRADWVPVRDAYVNRHHAVLFLDYFCAGGIVVNGAAEAREALRRGSVQTTP